jgi:hypothetical protein
MRGYGQPDHVASYDRRTGPLRSPAVTPVRRCRPIVAALALVLSGAACATTTIPGSAAPADPVGSAGPGVGGPAGSALFAAPEPWTRDVSALAPAERSDRIIAALTDLGGWGGGNRLQTDFSIALLTADGSTPRQTITAPADGYCYGGQDCDPAPIDVPIPTDGNAEGSADYRCDTSADDCHVLVVEQAEQRLYELYNSTRDGDAHTALGAFVWDLTKSYPDGMRGEQCTSADAAGFPVAGLLPTADEVAAGEVAHALRFVLPNDRIKAGVYVHPAGHAGGPTSDNPDAPPYGVRLRLKPSFDETPFSASERVVLRALKTYGMLLSDGGEIALTFADDRLSARKWSTLGVEAGSFADIAPQDFEVVDLGPEIALTFDCVRNP